MAATTTQPTRLTVNEALASRLFDTEHIGYVVVQTVAADGTLMIGRGGAEPVVVAYVEGARHYADVLGLERDLRASATGRAYYRNANVYAGTTGPAFVL